MGAFKLNARDVTTATARYTYGSTDLLYRAFRVKLILLVTNDKKNVIKFNQGFFV
jgi:hypothetical protein